jgi:hypothetical protein
MNHPDFRQLHWHRWAGFGRGHTISIPSVSLALTGVVSTPHQHRMACHVCSAHGYYHVVSGQIKIPPDRTSFCNCDARRLNQLQKHMKPLANKVFVDFPHALSGPWDRTIPTQM